MTIIKYSRLFHDVVTCDVAEPQLLRVGYRLGDVDISSQ